MKVNITPWRDSSELLQIRSQFYPPSLDGSDLRADACHTVEAWKLRGHLPHVVEATALLTDAILHDDAARNSVFSIRATYAAAFCRFVTGLVDSKLGGQRRTMFQRALDLGLPASFVELRHEATHRELPSLVVLRGAVQRSLEWLWGYYWGRLDVAAPVSTFASASASAPRAGTGSLGGGLAQIRDTLRQVSQQNATKRKLRMQTVTAAAQSLAALCQQETEGSRHLARVLLDEGALQSCQPGTAADSTFSTWDTLLQTITDSHPPFLTAVTEELALSLTPDNPTAEVIFLWLRHFLQSTGWEAHRPRIPISYLRAICHEMPNEWTAKLQEILASVSLSAAPVDPPLDLDLYVDDGWEALEEFGWSSARQWSGRPIGVA